MTERVPPSKSERWLPDHPSMDEPLLKRTCRFLLRRNKRWREHMKDQPAAKSGVWRLFQARDEGNSEGE